MHWSRFTRYGSSHLGSASIAFTHGAAFPEPTASCSAVISRGASPMYVANGDARSSSVLVGTVLGTRSCGLDCELEHGVDAPARRKRRLAHRRDARGRLGSGGQHGTAKFASQSKCCLVLYEQSVPARVTGQTSTCLLEAAA